jgi:DNA polymerase-3 subunit epsilon
MRQIVLDTETTGLEPSDGHRIIEIGCVELVNRRITGNTYHQYIQPDRVIDAGAREVHGITDQFLADKPRFADIAGEFLTFIRGAELIIHNAPFDVGFINHEFARLGKSVVPLSEHCTIVDTLAIARRLHPGQRNNLDALCKRYQIDNSQRDLHGALLDADMHGDKAPPIRRLQPDRPPLRVIQASAGELEAHGARLDAIDRAHDGACIWRRLEEQPGTPD